MAELLSFNSSGFQFAWDSTSLSTFAACPRKYLYSILQGWTAEIKSAHLSFGEHYARALEHFHKHIAAGVPYDDAVRSVVREALIATWDNEAGAPQEWMHNTKTRDTLIRSIVWYLEHFRNDPMQTVILSDGRPAVEYSFSVDLSDEYVYCGHIDRLVTYGDAGDIYIQDQKTSGSAVTPRFFDKYSPDYQMTGYTWAGQIIFNLPVKGVVIDAAYVAVGFTDFARQAITRSDRQLEEFRTEALHYIELARRCHEANYYPMNRTACGNYGGCEFRRVCSAVPGIRQNLLEGNYRKQDRWDPIRRR
jgi:hypothetical protein